MNENQEGLLHLTAFVFCVLAITVTAIVVLCHVSTAYTVADWQDFQEGYEMADLTPDERAYVMGPVMCWNCTVGCQLILEDGVIDLTTLELAETVIYNE